MSKIAEGSFNKIFRLNFDNGQSVIARIPPSRMFGSGVSILTASEVATLFVASRIDIRVPRVLAWSKESHGGSVGSPYIILEDIDGVSLAEEWRQPDMRGAPVAELLRQIALRTHQMTAPSFSQLGSLYFSEDFPSGTSPLSQADDSMPDVQHQVRIGPIADLLWWRPYHDEPDLDRGPWNTIEQYFLAAVRLERRALERHRQDPASLTYTSSSLEDLVEIENLLDKVEALAPKLQDVITSCSPHPKFLMKNVLMHPDLTSANVMVPKLTADNTVERMQNPILIDWQGAAILPLVLQFDPPSLIKYEPTLLYHDGRPVLQVNDIEEVPWPEDFDTMTTGEQEVIRAEHRLATRNVRWNQLFWKFEGYHRVLAFELRDCLDGLVQSILRACADGPYDLRFLLLVIQHKWDADRYGPCLYIIQSELAERFLTSYERKERYEATVRALMSKLNCIMDGSVSIEVYEASMKQLKLEKLAWDEELCGGPFPFEDGRWAPPLR